MLAEGKIAGIKNEQLWVSVPLTDEIKHSLEVAKGECVVELTDGRTISLQQRRKAYVLIKCISEGTGYTPTEVVKEMTKLLYTTTGVTLSSDEFSLSDCSVTTARMYIDFLVKFCIESGIECGEPLYKLCEDIEKYMWACAVNKKCAVCGRKAQWHHAEDRVGMGRSRSEICHIGMRGMPLCAKHHHECHTMPQSEFNQRYILQSVKVDERIAEVFKLRKRSKKGE